MSILRPFRAVRPAEDLASSIAALPYDVYTSEEARRAVGEAPLSFLRIDRAETQFPEGTDIYSDQVKRYELNDDNSTGDRGEFLPGDIPSSIILQNIYGDKYRYSSLSVQSTDSPSKTEDYED